MKVKKILFVVILILLIAFIVINAIWFFYRYKYYSQIASNSKVFENYDEEIRSYCYDEYDQDKNTTYSYTLTFPEYLSFGQRYSISTSLNYNDNMTGYLKDYTIGMLIRPCLFGEYEYTVEIGDLKNANNNPNLEYNTYTFKVNNKMEMIQEYSFGGTDIFNNAHDEIMEVFEKAKSVFNIDE